MEKNEDKLEMSKLRNLSHNIMKIEIKQYQWKWEEYGCKKQYIINSIYEKYGIKPYLILLYLVHLLNLLRRLNPHISCYVSWTSCVLSDFLKGKECLLSLHSIILLLHLSTLANSIPISSESTGSGHTIPMIIVWKKKILVFACCRNLVIYQ